jgi:hypothetical protein
MSNWEKKNCRRLVTMSVRVVATVINGILKLLVLLSMVKLRYAAVRIKIYK